MSGRLTTHVLDTARGRPAAGVRIELFRLDPRTPLKAVATNADGRTDEPLLTALEVAATSCSSSWAPLRRAAFYDEVPIRFRIEDAGAHYHVPLLVSPWSYSTYRGS